MFVLENVSYSYEENVALQGVTVTIERGESVCLLGPNGCGKSTFLRLLCGVIAPDGGTYAFDGWSVTRKSLADNKAAKAFHQRVGFVFQNSDTQLFCADVYEEVAFGPRQMGLGEDEVERRVTDCLRLLGLQDFARRSPYHLSGGEKRKTAIAAMLAMNPDALVLDEPMNGLDPKTERWLAGFLLELHSAGKTLITSTHDLELAQEISRRSILFDGNHTIAADLPTNLLMRDMSLLRRVNLVDRYYHQHRDGGHTHFHTHPLQRESPEISGDISDSEED
ncbi:MAG: energy-coupling factor ABC transporter ATP-binding protein [Oscillospiraceae bacterium]|jgi:cobalt/nickel transport system ATP-binding protein|nr:energy-coupling factor ABC transporter ATP-binding protein [Oscillospiraceae bacterium]